MHCFRPAPLFLAFWILPSAAAAESGAVAVGSAASDVEPETLRRTATDLLEAQGISLEAEDRVLTVTGGSLTSEPVPSAIEGWAAELVVDIFVAVHVSDASDGQVTLWVTLYQSESQRATSARLDADLGVIAEALEQLFETLLEPGSAEEDTTGESPSAEEPTAPEEVGDGVIPLSEVPEEPANEAPPPPPPERSRSGRVQFVLNSTVMGLSLMAGVLFAADVDDPRLFAPILLVGGAGGLAASLVIDRRWSVSRGDNSILAVGGWYGAATGVLIAGVSGNDDLRWLMTGGLIGEVVGLSAGIISAVFSEVSSGDGAVIHSGTIWGLASGVALATLVRLDDPRWSYGMILIGLHVGLGAGALISRFVEVSAGRMAVIDLCGLLGVLLGASIGIPIIVDSQSAGHMRAYAGILFGAAAAGIGLGILLTRRWDEARERGRPSQQEHRRRNTQISFAPVPTVIPPSPAVRGSRPTLGLQVIGGTW